MNAVVHWNTLALALIFWASAVGAVAMLWNKVLWPLMYGIVTAKKKTIPNLEKLDAMLPMLEKIVEQGDKIVTQVESNAGTSLGAKMERTEQAVGQIIDRLDVADGINREIASKLVETEAADRAHAATLTHLQHHADQFTEYEKYQRGRNHWLGGTLQRIYYALHFAGIRIPEEEEVPPMPPATPAFPGDDPELVPDAFPRWPDVERRKPPEEGKGGTDA